MPQARRAARRAVPPPPPPLFTAACVTQPRSAGPAGGAAPAAGPAKRIEPEQYRKNHQHQSKQIFLISSKVVILLLSFVFHCHHIHQHQYIIKDIYKSLGKHLMNVMCGCSRICKRRCSMPCDIYSPTISNSKNISLCCISKSKTRTIRITGIK